MKAVLCALLLCAALASALTIPEGYVLAPGGRLLHQSCFRQLEDGAHILSSDPSGKMTVQYPDGRLVEYPECEHEPIPVKQGTSTRIGASPRYDGYMLQVSEYYNPGFTEISGEWTTPQSPSNPNDQIVIYLWLGTDDYLGENVLQPVLQYGNNGMFGGQYWVLVSWFVTALTSNVGPIVDCTVGDGIFGLVQYNSTGSLYTSTATNTDTNESSVLNVSTSRTQDENLALVAMEGYNIESCDQLPASNGERFTQLTLSEKSGYVTPNWQPAVYYHECSAKSVVNSTTIVDFYWQS